MQSSKLLILVAIAIAMLLIQVFVDNVGVDFLLSVVLIAAGGQIATSLSSGTEDNSRLAEEEISKMSKERLSELDELISMGKLKAVRALQKQGKSLTQARSIVELRKRAAS